MKVGLANIVGIEARMWCLVWLFDCHKNALKNNKK